MTISDARVLAGAIRESLQAKLKPSDFEVRSKRPYMVLVTREGLLWRIEELGRGALDLLERGDVVAGALLTRGVLETTAVLARLERLVRTERSTLSDADLGNAVAKIMLGGRARKPLFEATNVQTLVQALEKEHLGATLMYETLSEIAHPNYLGTSYAFSQIDHEANETNFGRDFKKAGEPTAIVVSFLCSILGLAVRRYDSMSEDIEVWIAELRIAEADA